MADTIYTTRITEDASCTAANLYVLESGTYTCPATSSPGGAVYIAAGGNLTGTNVTFAGNEVTNNSNGGAIYNADNGIVNFSGTIDLQTDSDTWVNYGYKVSASGKEYSPTVNLDLTGGLAQYATIKGFQRYSNLTVASSGTVQSNQYITVNAAQEGGEYVIATGDFDMDTLTTNNSTGFTVTNGIDSVSITVNGDVATAGNQGYKLALLESGTPGADQLLTVYDERIDVDKTYTAENPYHLASGTYTCPAVANNGGAVYVHGTSGSSGVKVYLTGENITFKNTKPIATAVRSTYPIPL